MKKIVALLAIGSFFASAAVSQASAESYEVKEGDSLWKVAQKHDTTIQDLVDINNLDSTVIRPKQMLTINNIHTVEKGDTLVKIAKKYDVSVKEIKDWNNLNSDTIVVGQELELHSSKPKTEAKEEVKAKEAAAEENTEATKTKKANKSQSKASTETVEGKKISVTATAYTAKCKGCSGVTATGVDLNKDPNAKVIAVDPNVIPLGSKVYVEGYGHAIAADTGGAIKGNKIDIHVPSKSEANSWGMRTVEVTVLD